MVFAINPTIEIDLSKMYTATECSGEAIERYIAGTTSEHLGLCILATDSDRPAGPGEGGAHRRCAKAT
jgi:hypothetical protein